MGTVPNFLRGRHLTAVTIQPMTADTAGVLTTVATASSVSGYIDSIEFISDPAEEMIQSIDRTIANWEILYEDFSMELTEILRVKSGSAAPVLPGMASGADFFAMSLTRGGQSYAMIGKRGRFQDGTKAFGKNSCSLMIRPVDVGGTTSPVTFSG